MLTLLQQQHAALDEVVAAELALQEARQRLAAVESAIAAQHTA